MSIKDTLTNNSMNSFSFGGKTYTRRVDNNKVVYDISAGTDGSAFSTGWVDQDASGTDVENGANLTFVHNLGTTDIVTSAFVNSTASDTNAQQIPVHEVGTYNHGYAIVDMDANSITVNLADDGYFDVNSSGGGTYTSLSAKFFKLVIVAKMGSGGGGGTPAGSDRELQFNDNGTFGANANLKLDGSGDLYVPRLVVGEGNFAGDEGGEMALRQSETNNTLEGNWVYMDSHKNLIRFFEDGAPYKGAYIDLSQCADGVGTNLLAGGSGGSGGGGFIDFHELTTGMNYSPTQLTLPNFDDATQVVFVTAIYGSHPLRLVPVGSTYTVLGSGSGSISVRVESNGVVSSYDTITNQNTTVHIYRFTRSGAGGGGSGASVTTDTTAPTNPSDGDLWYDEDGAALYVYTDSIGGWIQANGSGGGGSGPRAYASFNPTEGAASTSASANISPEIYNSFNISSITDRGYFVYNGNQTGYRWTINLSTPVVNPVVHVSADNTATVGSYGLVPGSTTERYADIHANYHIEDDNTIHVFIVNVSGTGLPQDSYTHMSVTIF